MSNPSPNFHQTRLGPHKDGHAQAQLEKLGSRSLQSGYGGYDTGPRIKHSHRNDLCMLLRFAPALLRLQGGLKVEGLKGGLGFSRWLQGGA